jgi:hypothetical protein
MGIPNEPVTLTPEQVDDLNRKLSMMRHDVNNHLSLIVAAIELIRYKPEMQEKVQATLNEQPRKITDTISRFSAEFEQTIGWKRG